MITTSTQDSSLAQRLRRETTAEVLFDEFSRGLYSTDASIYQIKPLGVVVPKTEEDVLATISIANDTPALAEVLSSQRFDVATVSPKIAWDDRSRLPLILKQSLPGTALILFGHESDIVKKTINPGFAFGGCA